MYLYVCVSEWCGSLFFYTSLVPSIPVPHHIKEHRQGPIQKDENPFVVIDGMEGGERQSVKKELN